MDNNLNKDYDNYKVAKAKKIISIVSADKEITLLDKRATFVDNVFKYKNKYFSLSSSNEGLTYLNANVYSDRKTTNFIGESKKSCDIKLAIQAIKTKIDKLK